MSSKKTNVMDYENGMEMINSDLMEELLDRVSKYEYGQYTGKDVEKALLNEKLSIEDFAAILSPAAMPYLEEIARRSRIETKKYFEDSVRLFTPLYLSNYCQNNCTYCGFNVLNKIQRAILSLEEVEEELKEIAKTGLKEILILTGESPHISSVKYIGESIKIARKYFSNVGIEIQPLNSDEYAYLHKCGADSVSVYQETYNTDQYEHVHIMGPKRSFPYRFYSQERALLGGMHGVAFGALLGLDDFRKDAFATGLHALFVHQKYPHARISFSTPRLRPYINQANNPNDVHEEQLLQVILAYRLFMPFANITISTRENAEFRDQIIGLAATKMSAGVNVGVGGHKEEEKGDRQFEISDMRDVNQIHEMIASRGLQPVY